MQPQLDPVAIFLGFPVEPPPPVVVEVCAPAVVEVTLAAALHNNPREVLAMALNAIFRAGRGNFHRVVDACNEAQRKLAADNHAEVTARGWIVGKIADHNQ